MSFNLTKSQTYELNRQKKQIHTINKSNKESTNESQFKKLMNKILKMKRA